MRRLQHTKAAFTVSVKILDVDGDESAARARRLLWHLGERLIAHCVPRAITKVLGEGNEGAPSAQITLQHTSSKVPHARETASRTPLTVAGSVCDGAVSDTAGIGLHKYVRAQYCVPRRRVGARWNANSIHYSKGGAQR